MDYYERSFVSIWFVYCCIYHSQTCQTLIKENQETYKKKKKLEILQKVARFYFSPDQD